MAALRPGHYSFNTRGKLSRPPAAITLASRGGILLAVVIAQRDQNIQVAVVEIQKIPKTLLSYWSNEILVTIRPFVSTRVLWGSQRSGHPHRHTNTSEPCTSPGLASLPTRLDRWIRCSTHSTHREEAEDRVTYYDVCGGRMHANIQAGNPQ